MREKTPIKVGVRRLQQLAKLLRRVPPSKFDMGHWVHGLPPDMDPALEEICGTAACALGWATTLPFAKKLGAELFIRELYAPHGSAQEPPFVTGWGSLRTRLSPYPAEVIREFFGVDERIPPLFYGGQQTPKGKADEIDRLCTQLSKELQEGKIA